MPLEEYRKKRDFKATPEPSGTSKSAAGSKKGAKEVPKGEAPASGPEQPSRIFVVQKHAASRLHYDFRLELDGVLLSWAVPKGPSLDPHEKHLAVHVEDHPLEYASFEGTIPEGEYGGGTVIVWDRGTWEPIGAAAQDPQAGLAKGDFKFELHGEKLSGAWVLVRMKPRGNERAENWLLIKERDAEARPSGEYDILKARPESALSGRTIEQVAEEAAGDGGEAASESDTEADSTRGAAAPAVSRGSDPQPLDAPMQLAALVGQAPQGDEWLHEVKYDGYRLRASIDSGRGGERQVRLLTRSGQDWTERLQPMG